MIRTPERNPRPDPYAIACLLWRDEAIQALADLELARGFRTKRRDIVWRRLAEAAPLDHIRGVVRAALRVRQARIAELGVEAKTR